MKSSFENSFIAYHNRRGISPDIEILKALFKMLIQKLKSKPLTMYINLYALQSLSMKHIYKEALFLTYFKI